MKNTLRNLIERGEHRLVRDLKQVVAFDTRFPLFNEGYKCVYLLDVPIFDCHYEVHFEDGTKKLLSDKDACELLKTEREYNERIRDKATDQLKRINKFAKMGDLAIDPIPEVEPVIMNPVSDANAGTEKKKAAKK